MCCFLLLLLLLLLLGGGDGGVGRGGGGRGGGGRGGGGGGGRPFFFKRVTHNVVTPKGMLFTRSPMKDPVDCSISPQLNLSEPAA